MSIVNLTTRRAKLRAAALQERTRARLERSYRRPILRILNASVKRVRELYTQTASMTVVGQAIAESEKELMDTLFQLYLRAGSAGASMVVGKSDTINEVKRVALFGDADDTFISRVVRQWARTQAADKVTKISSTTRKHIRNHIENALADGLSIAETARRMTREMKVINRNRAIMIARTETHSGMQNASLEAARSLPAQVGVKKEWVSVEDERTRHSHDTVDGTTITLDEFFNVNGHRLKHPGDPNGPASEIINCRCTMVYHSS